MLCVGTAAQRGQRETAFARPRIAQSNEAVDGMIYYMLITHAGIADGMGIAFRRVCLSVCLPAL